MPTTFPATVALAGAAFTAMLQLSLVCERWPLGGIGRLRSGLAALALSWAAGTGAYFLFVNLDAIPAAERAAAGLRNPGGPIAGPDFGSSLIAVGVWQAVFFIALRGWPVNTISRRPHRLLAGNALVVGLGALTYLVLRDLAHWQRSRHHPPRRHRAPLAIRPQDHRGKPMTSREPSKRLATSSGRKAGPRGTDLTTGKLISQ